MLILERKYFASLKKLIQLLEIYAFEHFIFSRNDLVLKHFVQVLILKKA
jgi:hypothetical protein